MNRKQILMILAVICAIGAIVFGYMIAKENSPGNITADDETDDETDNDSKETTNDDTTEK